MNDKLYLLAGFDKDFNQLPNVLVASLDTLSTTHQLNWQSAPDTPWCASVAVILRNKFLLAVGGFKDTVTSEVRIFSPSTGQWKHLTNIPGARIYPAVVSVADNDIMVIGGLTNLTKYSYAVFMGVFE